jgi:hypothetical protein
MNGNEGSTLDIDGDDILPGNAAHYALGHRTLWMLIVIFTLQY